MKVCSACQLPKALADFHRHAGRADGRQTVCKACKATYNRSYYEVNGDRHAAGRASDRARLRDDVGRLMRAFKDAPCADCGRRLPGEAMDLDHVRGTKRGDATWIRGQGRATAQGELEKCDVVCVNCHRRRTDHRRRRLAVLLLAGWVPSESNRQPFG